MSSDLIPDTEYALREWLRSQMPGVKIWFGVPKGSPTFPLITIEGRIGGGTDGIVDNPRISFHVWGGPGGDGRKLAQEAMGKLAALLWLTENIPLDSSTFSYGAVVESIVWLPDTSDSDNPLARYVVDASFTVRSA